MSAECRHKKPLELGYGYARTSGWAGIGVTFRCTKCAECLWFDGDGNTPEEQRHNDQKRILNIKWKTSIDEAK
jgi:hypothetical protein